MREEDASVREEDASMREKDASMREELVGFFCFSCEVSGLYRNGAEPTDPRYHTSEHLRSL